jgi:hypothetical protein
VLIAPLDIAKLPHPWFIRIISALIPGFVFLGVVGYLRWDLVVAFQKTPVFSEGVKIAIFVLAADVSGVLISFVGLPLVSFYFVGYAIGYLLSKQTVKRNSQNVLWRRMAIILMGNQIIRLDEPAVPDENMKAELGKLAKSQPEGTPPEKVIEALVQFGAREIDRHQLDSEWAQLYRILESYLHPSSRDNLISVALVQSVGLAVACALVLCRTPNQSLLIIVAVLVTAASTLLFALVGIETAKHTLERYFSFRKYFVK